MQDRAQQLAIVQRMVDAGEPEQAIASVIQHFKTPQTPTTPERKSTGRPQTLDVAKYHLTQNLGDLLIGALKGGGETAINLGAMLHKVPGVSALVDKLYGQEGLSVGSFDAAKQAYTQPTNAAQSIGKGAEQVAELFGAGGVVNTATRGLGLGARVLAEGAAGAGMNAAQGQNATAGGVVGASVPVVGAGLRSARALFAGAGANPAVRDAVEWGVQQGIPVDAATATGAPIVRAIQGAADATPLGGIVASQARNQADTALTATGRRLANAVDAKPQDMLTAGESIQSGLTAKIQKASKEADDAYEALRKIESADQTRVPVGPLRNLKFPDGTTLAEGTEVRRMPMAVDLGTARKVLQPVYDRMLRASELAQPMGAEAKALKAIDRLMTAEGQYAPLSVVDDALSDLKGVLRSNPDKLGKGAGALNSVVASLDAQVMAAAKRAGPEAVKALQDGRAATVRKYIAADLSDRLGAEPARAAGKLVTRADTSVGLLRDLAKQSPESLPKVGRAVVDDLLETATQEGGFSRGAGLFEKWQTLGDETKTLLFKPNLKKDLDRFFLLAKRMGESPNPSMSGTIAMTGGSTALVFTNPATGIPLVIGAGALSKLLHSPKGAQMLTTLMGTPKSSPAYPGLMTNLSRVAGLEASQAIGGSR